MQNVMLARVEVTCLLVVFRPKTKHHFLKLKSHWRRHRTMYWRKQMAPVFFTAFDVCADANQELLIARKGFVPVKVKATQLTSTTAHVKALALENAGT